MQRQIACPNAFANIGRVMFDVGHAFASTCDHHIANARLNHHRGVHNGL